MSPSATQAILGATGFVGSTLQRALPGAQGFNSRTVSQAHGRRFDRLFCAAAPGSMFEANRDAERDAARIEGLIHSLRQIQADQFILISTIAVLERFDGGDTEADSRYQQETPYGVHRRRLELACQEHFPRCLVVRLPALFGTGLAKNFLFDLLNPLPTLLTPDSFERLQTGLPAALQPGLAAVYAPDERLGLWVVNRGALASLAERAALEAEAEALGVNAIRFHSRETTYQFYELALLGADLERALAAGLALLHLAPAPLRTTEIFTALVGGEMPATSARVHREDMRTQHAGLWGMEGHYNRTADAVLAALGRFYDQATGG